jgi:hypothetical protein
LKDRRTIGYSYQVLWRKQHAQHLHQFSDEIQIQYTIVRKGVNNFKQYVAKLNNQSHLTVTYYSLRASNINIYNNQQPSLLVPSKLG